MAATALLKFAQATVGTGADGQAFAGVLNQLVTVSNSDNTGVASWQIDLLYAAPGSSTVAATPFAFSNNGSTPVATFTPNVRRSYRFQLKVWSVLNRAGNPDSTDIRVFSIRELNGTFIPPPQLFPLPLPDPRTGLAGAKPHEMNFGGQPDGWAGGVTNDGLLNDFLTKSFLVSGSPSIGKFVGWDGSTAVWSIPGGLVITGFGASVGLVETGFTVTNPSFGASYNTPPTGVTLTNNADAESKDVSLTPNSFASSHSFVKNTPNQSVIFTITATLSGSPNAVANAGITWGQKVFWGVSSTPANTEVFIEGLAGSALTTSRVAGFTVNATGANRIYFACPTRYGAATFTVGGFVGGFILRGTGINVTNSQGFTEGYDLYESVSAGLGVTIVGVS
jgi:hypothetical protein